MQGSVLTPWDPGAELRVTPVCTRSMRHLKHVVQTATCGMYTGTSLIRNSPQDPTVDLCVWPYGGPRGVDVSYEPGTPAACGAETFFWLLEQSV